MHPSKTSNSGTLVGKRPLPPKPLKETKKEVVLPLPPAGVEKEEPEDPDDQDSEESVARAPRKKATISGHIQHYDQIFELLDTEIDRKSREKEKGTRTLKSIRKILTQMRKEVPQVTRSKEARKQSSTRKETTSGLMMTFAISKELADFLQIPEDTRLSRIEVTRAICVYSHLKDDEKREEMLRWKYLNPNGKRDLQFPQDKKAIIPDKSLSKLLRYDIYKKKVAAGQVTHKTKNKETGKIEIVKVKTDALYYWAIQNLLNVHFLKEEASSTEDEQEKDNEEDE
jgi:chromatin remodeling complex protein RSC6